jgi:hypothetical protein
MRKSLAFCVVAIGAIAILAFHQVPLRTTSEDAKAVDRLLPEGRVTPRNFQEEVALILRVQDRVLAASPEERGIALDEPRELQNLLIARHGAGFDRSRAIETILRYYGFRTRHASMYSTADTGSALRSLATKDTISHALTEVERGADGPVLHPTESPLIWHPFGKTRAGSGTPM